MFKKQGKKIGIHPQISFKNESNKKSAIIRKTCLDNLLKYIEYIVRKKTIKHK